MSKDSDAVAALAKRLRKAVREIRSVDVNTDSDSVSLANATGDILVIATELELSSPTKTLEQVAPIQELRAKVVKLYGPYLARLVPMQEILDVIDAAILTTSTDETDGKGGTGD